MGYYLCLNQRLYIRSVRKDLEQKTNIPAFVFQPMILCTLLGSNKVAIRLLPNISQCLPYTAQPSDCINDSARLELTTPPRPFIRTEIEIYSSLEHCYSYSANFDS